MRGNSVYTDYQHRRLSGANKRRKKNLTQKLAQTLKRSKLA